MCFPVRCEYVKCIIHNEQDTAHPTAFWSLNNFTLDLFCDGQWVLIITSPLLMYSFPQATDSECHVHWVNTVGPNHTVNKRTRPFLRSNAGARSFSVGNGGVKQYRNDLYFI